MLNDARMIRHKAHTIMITIMTIVTSKKLTLKIEELESDEEVGLGGSLQMGFF